MGATFNGKYNKVCATCVNWQGSRKASLQGFVNAETVSASCDVSAIKSQKFSFQSQTCMARPGQDLWQLWGPLKT